MIRSSGLSALSALMAGAGAIMIPPAVDFSATGNHGPGGMGLVDPFTQMLEVHCVSCSYAQKQDQGGFIWTQGVENSLYANISIGTHSDTIEFNGAQFWPPSFPLTAEPEPIFVTQAPQDTSFKEIRKNAENFAKLRLTSWSFLTEKAHTVSEGGDEILTIRFSLNALEQQPIEVDDIVLTALKRNNGQLMLLKSDVERRPSSPHAPTKECNDWPLLCKWRAIIADRLQQMRGKFRGKCHKRPHGQKAGVEGQMEGHKRPHHHHHHGRPKAHKEHHPVMNKIAHFLLVVVIPILIGILAGMLTYLVGMLIGTGIALLWIRLRGRRAEYSRVALDEEEELEAEMPADFSEKEVVPIEQYADAPPQYIEVEAKETGSN